MTGVQVVETALSFLKANLKTKQAAKVRLIFQLFFLRNTHLKITNST